LNFDIVDISASTIPPVVIGPDESTAALEAMNRPGRIDLLGPGDVLLVEVFEVGISLFGSNVNLGTVAASGPGDGFSPTARGQQLGVLIDGDGKISLPYMGSIQAAGRTVQEVQEAIVQRLRTKSQAPQALVTVRDNITNTIQISGSVAQPGLKSLTLSGEHLLDAIARSGGLKGDLERQGAVVRFTREGQTVSVLLDRINPDAKANLRLLPGDRIDVAPRTRSFTVFGAVPRVSEIMIQAPQINLAEAVARAGGPADLAADPSAVFVFRNSFGEGKPTIYRLNLLKPSSYFIAQRFIMQDKDVIYIANARSNQTRKLVEIVNLIFSPFFNARSLAR
jgi:polysaccharide export outer membrane protein